MGREEAGTCTMFLLIRSCSLPHIRPHTGSISGIADGMSAARVQTDMPRVYTASTRALQPYTAHASYTRVREDAAGRWPGMAGLGEMGREERAGTCTMFLLIRSCEHASSGMLMALPSRQKKGSFERPLHGRFGP